MLGAVNKILSTTKNIDGHVIHVGNGADIGHMPRTRVNGKQFSRALLLYAFHQNLDPSQVGKIKKICSVQKCINPEHYCLQDDFFNSPKDENGWTSAMRKMFQIKLGLWQQPITDSCIFFRGHLNPTGYGSLSLDKYHRMAAHIVSLRLKIGRPLLPKMQASHLCAHPACINPKHLIEESVSENNQRKTTTLLTKNDVIDIMKLRSTMSVIALAKKFQVSRTTISSIFSGHTWAEVTGNLHTKPSKRNVKFSEEMLDQIVEIIQTSCDEVIDENTQEVHLIPRNAKNLSGYVKVQIFGINTYFHVLAAIISSNLSRFPNAEDGEYALHSCRRRDCCSFDHLRIGTHVENMQQKKHDGTHRNFATISQDVAKQIKLAEGSCPDIARRFNVSLSIVSHIKQNECWSSLT